ncbi:MAG TPA: NAD(P)/FAD-dependent oxidoreductase [Polyangiaceae bacterium]|nr:NAD(P)/FAD-dependent oxidoreductase [Polyangiaceae bacterium]
MEHFDVVIVGAGLSGIGAGCRLQENCPRKSYTILEARECIGGTWDLFRYPGVRSDSDMYTLGYPFRPWDGDLSIADGSDILNYVRSTAREYDVDSKIRFGHRVKSASWSADDTKWTIEAEILPSGDAVYFTCSFLLMCSGYYDYAEGFTPDIPGRERFAGRVVHPQAWTDDITYEDKRVAVIGSGATAVTMVPALARKAAHVVMVQRSPSYIVSVPARDAIADYLRRHLPDGVAQTAVRWKNVLRSMLFFELSRRTPDFVKRLIPKELRSQLGTDYDLDTHFKPKYNPWDQRVCLVPDGDLFEAIRDGRASVVTDGIAGFTEKGLALQSGEELEADLVVTATGLSLLMLGNVAITVDGEQVDVANTMSYKGLMFSDIPNFAFAFGYTNASWTLKSDLTCEYVCRLLNFMDRKGYRQCTPRRDPRLAERPLIDFSSSYVVRALDKLPKQGHVAPWKLYQNYALDLLMLRYGTVADGVLGFS